MSLIQVLNAPTSAPTFAPTFLPTAVPTVMPGTPQTDFFAQQTVSGMNCSDFANPIVENAFLNAVATKAQTSNTSVVLTNCSSAPVSSTLLYTAQLSYTIIYPPGTPVPTAGTLTQELDPNSSGDDLKTVFVWAVANSTTDIGIINTATNSQFGNVTLSSAASIAPQTTTAPSSNVQDSGISSAQATNTDSTLIGIVIGSVIGGLILLLAALCLYRRAKTSAVPIDSGRNGVEASEFSVEV